MHAIRQRVRLTEMLGDKQLTLKPTMLWLGGNISCSDVALDTTISCCPLSPLPCRSVVTWLKASRPLSQPSIDNSLYQRTSATFKHREEGHQLIQQMRVERCDFSGYRIYPSKGRTYVRGDSKVGFGLDHTATGISLGVDG